MIIDCDNLTGNLPLVQDDPASHVWLLEEITKTIMNQLLQSAESESPLGWAKTW